MHIAHVQEQTVQGYLCESNSNKWTKHIFSYNRISTQPNILTYFYQFEFQQGTVHLHLLVWLKDISKIQHHFLQADIPHNLSDLSFYVQKYQTSDKPSHSLQLQDKDSYIETRHDKKVFHLEHPAEEFALNLRAYVSTLLPALKCSMDFQTTDRRTMLLRYVSSYVNKCDDDITADSYSYHVSGVQTAIRYVMQMKPAEPEMWLALSSRKTVWSSSRTKCYIVTCSDTAIDDKIAMAYRCRPQQFQHYTFLQWLRTFNHIKAIPTTYKFGNT